MATATTQKMIASTDHKKYLEKLRQSGVVNMFGAGAYLEREFGLSKTDANSVLSNWMKTYRM